MAEPWETLAGIELGFRFPAARCEMCKRVRKLKGRRKGERYCRECHIQLPDQFIARLIKHYD